jgi:hypothetical protein
VTNKQYAGACEAHPCYVEGLKFIYKKENMIMGPKIK